MALQIGYANIEIYPFLDDKFTPDPSRVFVLTPDDFDTADELDMSMAKNTETLIRGSGGKDVYETTNAESGIFNLTMINPIADRLIGFIFPDSKLTVDGTKIKRDFFDSPGAILSTWDRMAKVVIKPLGANKQPVAPNYWMVLPRCVIKPSFSAKFSQSPGKTELQIISLGGYDKGTLAKAVGDIDLSSPIDLSAGGNDKLLKIIIESAVYNVNLGQGAATTSTQILDAINTAVGAVVATLDANNFLNVQGFLYGGQVTIDNPTAGASAYSLVYSTVKPAPDVVNGTAGFDVPTMTTGDETAV